MSRGTFKTIGTIAAVAALAATGVGAFAAAGTALAATAGSVAAIATVTAGVANLAATIGAPTPTARGNITRTIIAAEPPRPYLMGEAYSAGILRHREGYGATLDDVPNPYYMEAKVFSGVGPVNALVGEQFDFGTIGSYYTSFYDSDTQLGARPEASALVAPYGTPSVWTASHKLSGCAAILSNYLFDKEGEVYASGRPAHGAIWQGEKYYDPRLDDTYAGGSGACRLGTESTYVYGANPALHAATYAYGRFENGIKVFGIGLGEGGANHDDSGIDWEAVVDWANDCDTNSWECHGTIFEGGKDADPRQQRVANLDDICAAGGGRWFDVGGKLSFDWHRPRVSLATITDDDLLPSGIRAVGLQSQRDRMNGVFPEYISPTHNWEQITAEEIVNTTYRTEDGQKLTQVWPLNLVKDPNQAGQLASYAMADSREIGPIEGEFRHELRFYRPGETLTLQSDLLGYNGQVVIMERGLNPETMDVPLKLKTENPAKHAFALGESATPPPTPTLGQSQEGRDAVISRTNNPRGAYTRQTSVPAFPVTPGDGQIVIVASTSILDDGRNFSFPAHTETGLAQSTRFVVLWDLVSDAYVFSTDTEPAELKSKRYVKFGAATTSDGTSFPPPESPPDGYFPEGGGSIP